MFLPDLAIRQERQACLEQQQAATSPPELTFREKQNAAQV
jgi:hypothetical protein